jgi:hypothetical protein
MRVHVEYEHAACNSRLLSMRYVRSTACTYRTVHSLQQCLHRLPELHRRLGEINKCLTRRIVTRGRVFELQQQQQHQLPNGNLTNTTRIGIHMHTYTCTCTSSAGVYSASIQHASTISCQHTIELVQICDISFVYALCVVKSVKVHTLSQGTVKHNAVLVTDV